MNVCLVKGVWTWTQFAMFVKHTAMNRENIELDRENTPFMGTRQTMCWMLVETNL
jgi:hypothetical protein